MKFFNYISLLSLLTLLTGCFDNVSSSETRLPSLNPYISEADFTGIQSVKNLTTGIRITWEAVANDKQIQGYNVYRIVGSTPVRLATLGPEVLSYIDGSVISGTRYKYMVKAVNPVGNEDANQATLSVMAWEGLLSAQADSSGNIQVLYNKNLQQIVMQIYISYDGSPNSFFLVKELSSLEISAGSYTISNLGPVKNYAILMKGFPYSIRANIYESNDLNKGLDGNEKTFLVSTNTIGFHLDTDGTPGYRGTATVRAFGRSPNTLGAIKPVNGSGDALYSGLSTQTQLEEFTPQKAQVQIGFLPFKLPQTLDVSNYRYVILRFSEKSVVDTSSITATCPINYDPISSLEPCLLKEFDPDANNVGGGPENGLYRVTDKAVWYDSTYTGSASLPRYRYTMALKHLYLDGTLPKSYVEKIPQDDLEKYSVSVPVPPDNMTLVNRESVNFEYCVIQRNLAYDPTNHNRCHSIEVGSTTKNSGPDSPDLSLESGYYDFGYNLFVDRYPLACKATGARVLEDTAQFKDITDPIGRYGELPSGSPDPLPAHSVGYVINDSSKNTNCIVREDGTTASGWKTIRQVIENLPPEQSKDRLKQLLTNAPENGINRFKFSYSDWTSTMAQKACGSFSDSNYGNKRIPRMREFRAFMAPPFQKNYVGNNVVDFYYQPVKDMTNTKTAWSPGHCVVGTSSAGSASNYLEPLKNYTGDALFGNNLSAANYINNLLSIGTNSSGFGFYKSNDLGPYPFALGSSGSAGCMSKYGVGDILESPSNSLNYYFESASESNKFQFYPTSDYFMMSASGSSGYKTSGLHTPIDAGNNDVYLDIDGYPNGYSMFHSASTTPLNTTSFVRIDLALGLPVYGNNASATASYSPMWTSTESDTKNYGLNMIIQLPTVTDQAYHTKVTARYSTSFDPASAGDTTRTNYGRISGVRCVLSAD